MDKPSPPSGGEGWVRGVFIHDPLHGVPRKNMSPAGLYPPKPEGLGPRLRGENGR